MASLALSCEAMLCNKRVSTQASPRLARQATTPKCSVTVKLSTSGEQAPPEAVHRKPSTRVVRSIPQATHPRPPRGRTQVGKSQTKLQICDRRSSKPPSRRARQAEGRQVPVPANTHAVREAHKYAPAQGAPGMPNAPSCALGPPAGCESGWKVCKSRGERATSDDWTCVTWTLWQTFPACPHAWPLLHRSAHM